MNDLAQYSTWFILNMSRSYDIHYHRETAGLASSYRAELRRRNLMIHRFCPNYLHNTIKR
jgi:hypothetical protein